MMDLETYEKLLKLARKYRIDSFSYGDVTVNLLSDYDEDPVSNPGSEMHEDTFSTGEESGDPLLTNVMIGQ